MTEDEYIIASFEGPSTYWSIRALYDDEADSFDIWVYANGDEHHCICRGVGRWYSNEYKTEKKSIADVEDLPEDGGVYTQ